MIKSFRIPAGLIGLLLLLCYTPLTMGQTSSTQSLTIDGQTRSYSLYSGRDLSADTEAPLLIALHDAGSSGRAMQVLSHLDEQADRYGFRIAYPDGINIFWDDGRYDAGAFGQIEENIDDTAFLLGLIDELTANEAVDPNQIYLTGLGNGAAMAFSLACEYPERFAGVATVGALLWTYQQNNCPAEASASLNILAINGTRNPGFPMEGRSDANNPAEDSLNLNDTVAFWVERNQCDPEQSESVRGALYVVFNACADGSESAFILLTGARGEWPRTGDYRLNQYGFDASDVIGAFISPEADWRDFVSLDESFNEDARQWSVYVPSTYDGSIALPLVMVLHGRPGTAASIAYITDMNRVAEREQFIVVYPQGLGQTWNAIRGIPVFESVGEHDDAAFFSDLIADLGQDLAIDTSRIYAMGFSYGGLMTQRLACETPEQYAAVATVAASAFFGLQRVCENSERIPHIYIQGTQDVNFPWNGVPLPELGENQYIYAPPIATLSFWVNHNGCLSNFTQEDLPPSSESSSVSIFRYPGCMQDVLFYGILNGGHNWPGVTGRIAPQIAGIVNTDINASEVIWEFFSTHSR